MRTIQLFAGDEVELKEFKLWGIVMFDYGLRGKVLHVDLEKEIFIVECDGFGKLKRDFSAIMYINGNFPKYTASITNLKE